MILLHIVRKGIVIIRTLVLRWGNNKERLLFEVNIGICQLGLSRLVEVYHDCFTGRTGYKPIVCGLFGFG